MGLNRENKTAPGGILGSSNRLRLGMFGANDELYGMYETGHPLLPKDQWTRSVWAAREVDRIGFEVIVPVSTWPANSFDPVAWSSAISASTEQADVFVTLDVGVVHPVTAAKQLVTIDHVSGGRVGLNIVAGWRQLQADAHGVDLLEHDTRYDRADEWLQLVRLLWSNPQEDAEFAGDFYTSKVAAGGGRPVPLREGGPPIMNAGTSARALEFVAAEADLAFVHLLGGKGEEEAARATVDSIKASAAERGREIQVWSTSPIVCRDTDEEADEYLAQVEDDRRQKRSREEREAELERMRAGTQQYDGFTQEDWQKMLEKPYSTYGGRTLGIHGNPERVVERLAQLSDWGIDGLLVVWPDWEQDIPYFERSLLPLIEEAGLRERVGAPSQARR